MVRSFMECGGCEQAFRRLAGFTEANIGVSVHVEAGGERSSRSLRKR